MSEKFDPAEMVQRFRDRAEPVRNRQLPSVEGEARKDFIRQAKRDHRDFAIVGDGEVDLTDGILGSRIDLRSEPERERHDGF